MISFVNDYYDFGITKPVFQYAASETAKAGAQFRYFESIVKDLLDKGIKTEDDLTRHKAEYAKKKPKDTRKNAESLKYMQRADREEVPFADLTEGMEDEE
jgi:hypothetical protein